MKPNRALFAGLLCVLSIATTSPAAAAIIVSLDVTPVSPGFGICEGYYIWSFSASGTPTDGFTPDDQEFITVYDIPGTICTAEPGALFGIRQRLTGFTPAGQTPTDDPALPNLTATYTGPSSRPLSSVSTFEYFMRVFSSVATPAALQYSWQDYSAYPVSTGVLQSGIGTISLAGGNGDGGSTQVPEPGSALLLSLGLAGILAAYRRGHPRPDRR